MTNRELAEKIAEDLFTNGAGQKADRLQLKFGKRGLNYERDLGGWGFRAMVGRIELILNDCTTKGQNET